MSGQTLRKKFMVRFTGMVRYSRWVAWAIVAMYVALITASVMFGHYLLSLPVTWLSVCLMGLTAVFIGTRFRGLNNIVHECSHSSFSSNREDNVALGRLCSALRFGCFREYKDDHLSHHAHIGDYERDAEFRVIENLRLHEDLSVSTILRLMAAPLLGLHLKAYSGVNLSAEDGRFFFGLKIFFLIALVAFLVLEPLTTILFVIVPLFFIFPTINFWTDCLDHAGLVGATDELLASRNVLASTPVRILFFPRNDCYHLVHHLFPQVPARHLHKAHEQLCSDNEYLTQPLATRPTSREVLDIVTTAVSPSKGSVAENAGG